MYVVYYFRSKYIQGTEKNVLRMLTDLTRHRTDLKRTSFRLLRNKKEIGLKLVKEPITH